MVEVVYIVLSRDDGESRVVIVTDHKHVAIRSADNVGVNETRSVFCVEKNQAIPEDEKPIYVRELGNDKK